MAGKQFWRVALDYGDYRKGKLVIYDGKTKQWEVVRMPFVQFIPILIARGVTHLVTEASSWSFDLQEKNLVLETARRLGLTIGIVPTKQTAKHRADHGLEDCKSDEIDVAVIWSLANETTAHVALMKPPSKAQLEKQKERHNSFEGRALVLRSLGWPEEESREFTQYLPPIALIPEFVRQTGLWDRKAKKLDNKYCLPLVAASLQVLADGGDREDFGRKVGWHAFGYPSYLRSNFYHWMLRWMIFRNFGVKSYGELARFEKKEVKEAFKRLATQLKKACRWLFHKVAEAKAAQANTSAAAE